MQIDNLQMKDLRIVPIVRQTILVSFNLYFTISINLC